jgi:hypothetical protein
MTDLYLETSLPSIGNASYYTDGQAVYGLNSTSYYDHPEGFRAFVKHGNPASQVFVGLRGHQNMTKRDVDPYNNGFYDEWFVNGGGFKGQYCNPYGSSESVNPVYDWSTMKELVWDVIGSAQSGRSMMLNFQLADMNHNETEIANV